MSYAGSGAPAVAVLPGAATGIAAAGTDYLSWSGQLGLPYSAVMQNLTGGTIYVKMEATSITPGANATWYHLAIADGDILPVPPAQKYALYVPAGGSALVYSGATKNFSLIGYFS